MNANDDTPEDDTPGMGSFYDVFKDIATGSNRLEEILDMDLPDGQGMVRLLDPDGNLISYLAYRSATFNGLNRGFHKPNPFSNMAIPGPATLSSCVRDSPSWVRRVERRFIRFFPRPHVVIHQLNRT